MILMAFNRETMLNLVTIIVAEVIASAILLYVGCMGCVDNFEFFTPTHLTICLIFGFAIMIAINCTNCISGSHITPAITIAAYVYRKIDLMTAAVYVFAECLGSLVGYWLVRLTILPQHLKDANNFCLNLPNYDPGRALMTEFITTFILIVMVCAVWDPRNSKYHDSAGLRLGLAVTALAFIGGPFGGGSLNPARSFAPALYNWNWTNHWIYWVGPSAGGLAAAILFRYGFHPETKKNESFDVAAIERQNDENVEIRSLRKVT